MPDEFLGLIEDPREDKSSDYTSEEFLSGSSVDWVEKQPYEWNKFSTRNQINSSSCVGQATAKAIEIFTGVSHSAHPQYRRRWNYPFPGSYPQDVADKLKKLGTTTELLDPSVMLGEADLNKDVTIETPVKIDGYFTVPLEIDAIAQAFDQYKNVILSFKLNGMEWIGTPTVLPGTTEFIGHCICMTDRTLYNGSKSLIVEDSANLWTSLGGLGQRVITEAFFNARCTNALVLIPSSDKPHFNFTKDLYYGLLSNQDVRNLQDALKIEGCMPKSIPSTGNYLGITRTSVGKFQEKYGIAFPGQAGHGRCGPKTRGKLNLLFS